MFRIEQLKDLDTAKKVATLLEKENQRLHKRLIELTAETAKLRGEDGQKQLELEIARLQQQMGRLQKELFGRSSERRRNGSDTRKKKSKGKQKGHGPRQQPELPKQTCLHLLEEEKRVCELCGKVMEEWGGQTEDSEMVTVVRRQFVLEEHKRQKYRCKCGAAPMVAPGPVKLFPGSRYSIPFIISVAISKYLDHLPLERQVTMMKREGLVIDSQTLWDQIERLAQVLSPCYQGLSKYLQSKEVLNVDETPWPLLKKPNKKWWIWSASNHDGVFYHFDLNRSTEAAQKLLGKFRGTLIVDGYISYQSLLKRMPGIVLSFCWSHSRRKFLDAEKYYPQECGEVLDLIDELFWIERQLPKYEHLSGEDRERALLIRKQARQIHSRAIVREIELWAIQQRALAGSTFADALKYLANHWKGLIRFIDDPRIDISNNRAERTLRGCCIGRKNHYGSKSVRGTEVAALFYTLLESAKLAGVDPNQYLAAATEAILKDPAHIVLPYDFAREESIPSIEN